MQRALGIVVLLMFGVVAPAAAQQRVDNYANRKAGILNVSPDIEVTAFQFQMAFSQSATRLNEDFTYKNRGSQPVVAFELVILRYDPFNRQLVGGRGVIPGTTSANYAPLAPGAQGTDGFRGLGSSDSPYTEVIYVRSVRRTDGSQWRATPAQVTAELKRVIPEIVEPGNVNPGLPKVD